MSQQNEKDYFVQQIKVLNWLLQHRADHREWFTFHLSTAQTSQFPFPGRGKKGITPNSYFYLDLITAAGDRSRYHLRLRVDLNTTYNSIVAVKLNLGVGGGATVPQDPVLWGVAGDLGFQLNGQANADRVIIENPADDESVSAAICQLIDNLGPHVYQTQNGGLRERVVSNQSFENELTQCKEQLVQKSLAICNPAGLMQLNDQAVFQIPQGGQNGAVNPDGDADEEDDDENQGEEGNLMRNKIVFGAPGTGKSHRLKEEAKRLFADANCERVTFYATYSYAQFVGTYKPVMNGEGADAKISYEFVPGPFLRTLVKALNRPDENFLLIIEEINRANAAAVFGDVFQLLDRGVDGVSEYSIAASEDVKKYLEKVLTEGGKQTLAKLSGSVDILKIPANLYLWATMNSADQGVFPLDTAFKRRWEFEYIGVNDEENVGGCSAWRIEGSNYRWNEVRRFINDLLSVHGVNEDKLMGPFFIKAHQDDGGIYLPIPQKQFESKVLMYLWEDAARMFRRQMFGDVKTYSQLLERWEDGGLRVFGRDIALGVEGALRDRYNAFVNPPAQPDPPNGDPQPPAAA